MIRKKLKINYGDGVLSIPKGAVVDSLAAAGEFNLKVLLLVCAEETLRDDTEELTRLLCERLDCTPTALSRAIKFWESRGVMSSVEGDEPAGRTVRASVHLQSSELPQYTEGDAADVIERNPDIRDIIDLCQGIVGKIFTPAEAEIVVSLYDHLRLDGEYIATLFAYCRDMGKRSLRYIEKTALSLYDEGIDTPQSLNDYIKRTERQNELSSQVKKLIGAGERQLTPKEKKLISRWVSEWHYDIDVITRAYEIMVDSTGGVKLAYMNRVLENWYNAGLYTLSAVEESIETYKKNKAVASGDTSGFETDEYFEAALARSQKYLSKNKS